jgi:hypothetical protein
MRRKMSTVQRKPGYYWVRVHPGYWIVAQWAYGSTWFRPGYERGFEEVEEVDERRIELPERRPTSPTWEEK